ncbi:hypothetical protein ABHV46_04955 [Asaia sp. BMEF1]|uniref:hypothetical protein n=1 Tax=Asaia sp. BMEF1 TaxID=3155932 RepID=UPI003F6733DB
MIQSLIVIALVVVALLFWLNRLFPVHATRLKAQLGIARQTAPGGAPKKGCNGCDGCKGGGCH